MSNYAASVESDKNKYTLHRVNSSALTVKCQTLSNLLVELDALLPEATPSSL